MVPRSTGGTRCWRGTERGRRGRSWSRGSANPVRRTRCPGAGTPRDKGVRSPRRDGDSDRGGRAAAYRNEMRPVRVPCSVHRRQHPEAASGVVGPVQPRQGEKVGHLPEEQDAAQHHRADVQPARGRGPAHHGRDRSAHRAHHRVEGCPHLQGGVDEHVERDDEEGKAGGQEVGPQDEGAQAGGDGAQPPRHGLGPADRAVRGRGGRCASCAVARRTAVQNWTPSGDCLVQVSGPNADIQRPRRGASGPGRTPRGSRWRR